MNIKQIIVLMGVCILVGGLIWWSSLHAPASSVVARDGIHWHPQIEIYVHGEKQSIPENIGLVGIHNPIHTHDDLPIIHMEFAGKVTDEDTQLKNFFLIWGKEFSGTQLFEYQNGEGGNVRMRVNGVENTEFENYHMRDGDNIEIRYE